MKVRKISLKLFMQYLSRKMVKATPFISHTLQLENNRPSSDIFCFFHSFFSSRVFVICSAACLLAHTAYIVSGKPPKGRICIDLGELNGLTRVEPLVC